jgi:hypothetical protein
MFGPCGRWRRAWPTCARMSELRAYLYGHGPWLSSMRQRLWMQSLGVEVDAIDVLDPSQVDFFENWNRANAAAYGGLAMPRWVQLDCATLPGVVAGFAEVGPHGARTVLSGFCALPTPEPGHVVGVTLFSSRPGLGVRTKALGLLAHDARTQTGIAQTDNRALSTHTKFGPLFVDQANVLVHDRPDTTLVYRLQVPSTAVLASMARGDRKAASTPALSTARRMSRSALQNGMTIVGVEGDQLLCLP